MFPSQTYLMVVLAVLAELAAAAAHASDRPKLPRGLAGAPCWQCSRVRNSLNSPSLLTVADPFQNPPFYASAGGDGAERASVVAAAEQAGLGDGFPMRLAPLAPLQRQGRSSGGGAGPAGPFWPLRHPALALDARKRHRVPEFQHPNVRFVNNHYFNDLGLSGPFVGGDDSWEEPKAMLDNRIRDHNLDKSVRMMNAEELIQALREKGWGAKDDVDDNPAMALRFGPVGKK